MQVNNYASIHGSLVDVFRYVVDVPRWPEVFPHYRSVRVIGGDGDRRRFVMAASRSGIPLWWQAVQECFPAEGRITFRHVGGFTRGMAVEWLLKEQNGWVHVRVVHDFELRWPLIGRFIADRVVGQFFVRFICSQTLRCIKDLVESASRQDGAIPSPGVGGRVEAASLPLQQYEHVASGRSWTSS